MDVYQKFNHQPFLMNSFILAFIERIIKNNKYTFTIAFFIIIVSNAFSQYRSYYHLGPQSYDSTSKKMQLIFAPKDPELAQYGGVVKFKQYVMIEGKRIPFKRKSLNPYFIKFPEAYRTWNQGYNLSYLAAGAYTSSLVFMGLEFHQILSIAHNSNPNPGVILRNTFICMGASFTTLITGQIISVAARNKKRKAMIIYNHHVE